jgi:hypothetical protein
MFCAVKLQANRGRDSTLVFLLSPFQIVGCFHILTFTILIMYLNMHITYVYIYIITSMYLLVCWKQSANGTERVLLWELLKWPSYSSVIWPFLSSGVWEMRHVSPCRVGSFFFFELRVFLYIYDAVSGNIWIELRIDLTQDERGEKPYYRVRTQWMDVSP